MNTQREQAKSKTRMVHIRLREDLHKRLRIRAAEADVTIQDWVTDAIKARLDGKNEVNKFQDD
jgi:predicted HicB family RNase H-like nuclease